MEPSWDDFILDSKQVDLNELLIEWRWLVDEKFTPIAVTAFGDLFLQSSDGSIHRLDAGTGYFCPVARNLEALKEQATVSELQEDWFHWQLLSELRRTGMTLGPAQCYSFRIPPILGGTYDISNFEPASLSVHHGILAQIIRQVKDLPPGTQIYDVNILGPDE